MPELSVQALVEAGAHIGCRVSRWNPKMEPYILEARNRIHIIDLRQTIRGILRARHFLRELVGSGEDVLIVGTKPQIRSVVVQAAERTGMPYVDDRWIGGTLTNYEVIGSRISFLEDMEKKEAEGWLDTLSSKEAARFLRQKRKIWRNLHGIREMFRLPGALLVLDPKTEANAVREAARMGIPVVAVVDTDGDPDPVDIVIPANDDAIRSVTLILEHLVEAIEEGKRLRKERGTEVSPEEARAAAAQPVAVAPTPKPRSAGRPRPKPGDLIAPSGVSGRVEITPMEEEKSEAPAPATPSEAAPEAAPQTPASPEGGEDGPSERS